MVRKMNDTMQTNLFMKSAVLIEQNPIQGKLYKDVLSANGFEVSLVNSISEGMVQIKENSQDLAVINTEIANDTCIEKFVQAVRSHQNDSQKQTPVIGLSIYKENNKRDMAKIFDLFLTKPISIDKFMESVYECIESKNGCSNFNN